MIGPLVETSTWQHTTLTKQTSIPPARFEPAIPTSERTQTRALDRTASEKSPLLFVLIFSFQMVGLSKLPFSTCFPIKIVCSYVPVILTRCPTHRNLWHFINLTLLADLKFKNTYCWHKPRHIWQYVTFINTITEPSAQTSLETQIMCMSIILCTTNFSKLNSCEQAAH